jgi:hypothetical protein
MNHYFHQVAETPPGEGIFVETVGASTPTNSERSTT